MAKPKRPVGRPTLYKPELCKEVIEHMSQGDPLETFGVSRGFTRTSVYEWESKHPEFADAIKSGRDAQLKWWFTLGKGLATNRIKGNTSVWIFTMKNMFAWRDVIETTTNVSIDGIVFDAEYDPQPEE